MSRLLDRRNAKRVNGLRRDPRTGAGKLAKSERGYGGVLAFDFTDNSAAIYDPTTQANVAYTQGVTDGNGNLRGPHALLTYTSPSNKLTRQADGYYKYQAHNLCVQSENLATTWTNSNSTDTQNVGTAPDGSNTANRLTATATSDANISQSPATVSGATYDHFFYAKAGTATYVLIAGVGAADGCWFNLSNGTVGTAQGGIVSSAIEDAGSGWYRCRARSVSTAGAFSIYVCDGDNSTAVTNGAYIDLWGAQVTRTPSVPDYIKTTSAANYALPIEYDTSGNCLGLLVEEARTNVVTYSTDFSNAAWQTFDTITDDSATAPNGLTNATYLEEISATQGHWVRRVSGIAISSGNPYTLSIYAKAAERSHLIISPEGSNFTWFNLSTGSVGTTSGSHTASIKDAGNGWYLCAVTFTAAATSTPYFYPSTTDGVAIYAGTAGNGIYIWGAQLEAGSFPTSPIVTYGATATRAVDNISIATSAFPYTSTASSIFIEYELINTLDTTVGTWHLIDSAGSNASSAYGSASTSRHLRMFNASATEQCAIDAGTVSIGVTTKAASAWAVDDFASVLDGGTVGTDVSGTYNGTPQNLFFGRDRSGSNIMTFKVKALSYVPRRKTDAELQTETT